MFGRYQSWGPFFLPTYFLAGAYALVMGRHPYFDNRFERDAREAEKLIIEKRKRKSE